MNKELTAQLQSEFPTFFEGLYGDPMQTCLAFGIECSDGWFNLIRDLCQKIKAANPPEGFRVEQVKEKFGGLRFYTNTGNDEIYRLIDEAESASYNICERCGTTEKVTSEGSWILTLCEACRASK